MNVPVRRDTERYTTNAKIPTVAAMKYTGYYRQFLSNNSFLSSEYVIE